jgi:hypothetical protein
MADYNGLREAVIGGNIGGVKELVQAANDSGAAPQEILDAALIPTMYVERGSPPASATFRRC